MSAHATWSCRCVFDSHVPRETASARILRAFVFEVMHITQLTLGNVRSVAHATLAPGPRFNLIVGNNGAGKTSVLEAVHLLSNGKSFRGRVADGLIRVGTPALETFARWETAQRRTRQIGLRHSGTDWEGRLDGERCGLLSELCTALASVTFEPGSHALIDGRSDQRRRMLDWGLFHVEPEFMHAWRRSTRALKQRNALLKQTGRAALGQLDAWESELASSGEAVTRHRAEYIDALAPVVQAWGQRLLPELGDAVLRFTAGWKRQELALADALLVNRSRDLATGFTSVGPHRADWEIRLARRSEGEKLSRGQTKLAALAMILAQAEHYAQLRGEWPVVLLDDLASELDVAHREAVLVALAEANAQVFVTATGVRDLVFPNDQAVKMFHVEHGVVTDFAP